MSSLGFQTVYRLLNREPGIRCERAFLYERTFERECRTLETQERLDRFDMIGFSLSYELDLINIIKILTNAGIPALSDQRRRMHPLIIAGGAVTSLNPSPLLPFVDGLLAGEGEGFFSSLGEVLIRSRQERRSKEAVLEELSHFSGVFVPGISSTVKRITAHKLDEFETYSPIVTSRSHFGNMFVVEVSRGCPRGCYFCAGKSAYKPFRFRAADAILQTVLKYNPGAERIGLQGAGLSDHPALELICHELIDRGYELSFSSLRPDRLNSSTFFFSRSIFSDAIGAH